jgi:hypothetical protein
MTFRQRFDFSDHLHQEKDRGEGGSKPNGDFTYSELVDLGRAFLDQGKA